MTPLIFGLVVLIAMLTYFIIFSKEGFANKSSVPTDLTDALENTLKGMPEDKVASFSNKLDALDKISDSSKKFYMMLNAFEDLRAYYDYSSFSFDVFMLKLTDSAFVESINDDTSDEEIKFALDELKRLKLVANVTDEMPSEKLLKAKQEASAAKKDAKQVKTETSKSMTPSEAQGAEFNRHRCEPPCPNVCESDDYIRKDSIPCWNCNLPRSD
jgi:hypothetical protein